MIQRKQPNYEPVTCTDQLCRFCHEVPVLGRKHYCDKCRTDIFYYKQFLNRHEGGIIKGMPKSVERVLEQCRKNRANGKSVPHGIQG